MEVLTVNNNRDEKFLRQKTAGFDFSKYSKKEIRELVRAMRLIMKAAEGIGLSANQIGINASFFVAEVEGKFYSVFNPRIMKTSEETGDFEEGCLSVPEHFGAVSRPEKIWLEGLDASGKKIKIKAWGFLARVFQHEVDHLNGVLFTDKCKELRKIAKEDLK